jgi:hypothetical protein
MFGMTNSKTGFLNETGTWTDKYGNQHKLTDMTEGYLRHVLSFLEDKAEAFFAAEIDEATAQQAVAVFEPWRYPDPDGHRLLQFESAHAWLESTPLVRAIRALLGEAGR